MTSDALDPLRACCARVGFDLDRAGSALLERMLLLAEGSGTFDDAVRLADHAHRVFAHYAKTKPDRAFDALERRTVVLASLFSDIGKTGPADAGADDRRTIVEAFAVENVRDDQQPVATFLRTYFAADAEERIARFAAMGIDPALSLREFWNLHAHWTLAISEAAGLPPEATAAAATHHMLDDVNPDSIVGDDDRFTRSFGQNTTFDRAEKLVILLDKYDAVRRRGGRSHEGAIAWLRERIAQSDRFRDDAELLELVADVDAAIGASP
ncbi:MAG: hypothetical protein KIT84_32255 [Labilithrix sp.]|nr:hypothetical protein [Labilithrix sp.]MCW5815746.1 hypothetical protein [Labilithrix sp.]